MFCTGDHAAREVASAISAACAVRATLQPVGKPWHHRCKGNAPCLLPETMLMSPDHPRCRPSEFRVWVMVAFPPTLASPSSQHIDKQTIRMREQRTLEAERQAEMMAFWMAFRSGQNILDMRNWLPELQLEAETNQVATTIQIQDIDSNSETCFGEHDAMRPIDMGVESMRTDTNKDLLVFVGSVDGHPTTWNRYVQTDGRTEDVDPEEEDDAANKTDNHDTNAPQQPGTEASGQPATLSREEAP
ncbi:hypothetical protein BDN71DRAFT_1437410 [Pleurotus eryngii]|uniref:Uncharacterized protein n=1 Tax=Pleurotus eryngii TaxID=5323 RepID=A0A9P5ZEM7_PLEER|nr:hypothetical protein BDN71DRAFT_1437410 [Pleurotus eryngii]